MARTNRPDEAYHIPALNVWFAISSLALLITCAWMILHDYTRSWKEYQRDFREIERTRFQIESMPSFEEAKAELEAVKAEKQEQVTALQTAINEATAAVKEFKFGEHLVAKTAYNGTKAEVGEQKYFAQKAAEESGMDSVEYKNAYRKFLCAKFHLEAVPDEENPADCKALPEGKSLRTVFLDADDTLKELEAKLASAKKARTEKLADVAGLEAEVKGLEETYRPLASNFFNDTFRNAPVVDFLAPDIKIRQAVVKDIRDDYNFATVQKEDRCMTCHMGIDKKDYSVDPHAGRFEKASIRKAIEEPVFAALLKFTERKGNEVKGLEKKINKFAEPKKLDTSLDSWLNETLGEEKSKAFHVFAKHELEEAKVRTQVFKAHPDIDLIASASSKHPMNEMGCTVCHEGRGHAVEFQRAYHTPSTKEQESEWIDTYGYDPPHYWDKPQLPSTKVSATCAKCHTEPTVAGADAYNRGRKLVEQLGCYGCHRMEGLTENLRKAGPSLRKLASKIDKEFAYSWIWNPQHFRPSSKMPRFFGQTNQGSDEEKGMDVNGGKWYRMNQQEVRGMVAYLFNNTEAYRSSQIPVTGDATAGKELFEEVGCLACHSMQSEGYTVASHGPDLSGIGTKLSADWVYGWLKNPRAYFPKTHMPSLRLSNQEAANITAYLMDQKKSDWRPYQAPVQDVDLQKSMIRDALSSTWRRADLEKMLASLGDRELEIMVGDRAMKKHGCAGCHNIVGFEDVGPIGAELTLWADKYLTQLDFGGISYHGSHAEVDHSHIDWARNKLRNPRVWDRGMTETKAFTELLKMPKFNLTEAQIEDVVTFLMSRTKQQVTAAKKPQGTDYEKAAQGHLLARQYNCQGCHYFNGEGGDFAQYWGEKGFQAAAGRPDFDYMAHVKASLRGTVPPMLLDQGNKTQPDWLFKFLQQPVTLRPKLKMRMPSFQFNDDETNQLVQMFAGFEKKLVGDFNSYQPDPELVSLGEKLFINGRCTQCHLFQDDNPANIPASIVAPNLKMATTRLQHDWIIKWLANPQSIMPGANMPNYFDLEAATTTLDPDGSLLNGDIHKGLKALTDYLVAKGKTYKSEYAQK